MAGFFPRAGCRSDDAIRDNARQSRQALRACRKGTIAPRITTAAGDARMYEEAPKDRFDAINNPGACSWQGRQARARLGPASLQLGPAWQGPAGQGAEVLSGRVPAWFVTSRRGKVPDFQSRRFP